ncbi:MAG: sigma 54-interacting transcriptional regulator, partial [Vicinamibacteria bacterium]
VEADRASIFLLDPEKRELVSQVALGSAEPLRFDARLGIAGAVALSGETINVPDTSREARFFPGIDARSRYRTRNLLAVPLRSSDGEAIGAFEVLNKKRGSFGPEDTELLRALAAQATIAIQTARALERLQREREELVEENQTLRLEVESRVATAGILGTSEPIQRIVRTIEQIATSAVSVLITGESGTGKELVARAIHAASERARGSFVALNCAALPENLVEAELFGIEKGVATGVDARIGKIEQAQGGTLFLDEIGDLSLTSQAKILRALEERVIERVGGRRPISVDVRILAATNRDLEAEIRRNRFREDLFYRLNVILIRLPSLREISGDIPLLANSLLRRLCREAQEKPKTLAPGAQQLLVRYA